MSEPKRKISNKEQKYLSWQNPDKTWRQFWEEIQGKNPSLDDYHTIRW